jgi:hypothetical protein
MGADFPGPPGIGAAGRPAAAFAGAAGRPEEAPAGTRFGVATNDFLGAFGAGFLEVARLWEEADFFLGLWLTFFFALGLLDLALSRADVFRAMKEPPLFQEKVAGPRGGIVRV